MSTWHNIQFPLKQLNECGAMIVLYSAGDSSDNSFTEKSLTNHSGSGIESMKNPVFPSKLYGLWCASQQLGSRFVEQVFGFIDFSCNVR